MNRRLFLCLLPAVPAAIKAVALAPPKKDWWADNSMPSSVASWFRQVPDVTFEEAWKNVADGYDQPSMVITDKRVYDFYLKAARP